MVVMEFGSHYLAQINTTDNSVTFANKKKNTSITLKQPEIQAVFECLERIKNTYPKSRLTNISESICIQESEFMTENYVGIFQAKYNGQPNFKNGTNILAPDLFQNLSLIIQFVKDNSEFDM